MTAADVGRWVAAAGITAGSVYVVSQWSPAAAWWLVLIILLGTLIARPGYLATATKTIETILGPGPNLTKAPAQKGL